CTDAGGGSRLLLRTRPFRRTPFRPHALRVVGHGAALRGLRPRRRRRGDGAGEDRAGRRRLARPAAVRRPVSRVRRPAADKRRLRRRSGLGTDAGIAGPVMIRLYNTLTRSEEPFEPLAGNTVRMYTCGLTVYARGHIGNFRTFICVDVLRRTLKYLLGYEVKQVMNFTDVDDRTIVGAANAKMDLRTYTDRYIAAFREDTVALGLEGVEETPRATDEANLAAMANMIAELDKNGHTYRSDGSIYFKISTLPTYGKLARL